MKWFYLYKIINKINHKIYIGIHRTNNIEDGYMGSGLLLKKDIEIFGIENFDKEILYYFDNESDMYKKEKEIVDHFFILREDTYNMSYGGYGGFKPINPDKKILVECEWCGKEKYIYKHKYNKVKTKVFFCGRSCKNEWQKGRMPSEETLIKMREANSGENNGRYIDGHTYKKSYCACGNEKDHRAKICIECRIKELKNV
jgi:hypothetical protein